MFKKHLEAFVKKSLKDALCVGSKIIKSMNVFGLG